MWVLAAVHRSKDGYVLFGLILYLNGYDDE
jgi:hypothetical protein